MCEAKISKHCTEKHEVFLSNGMKSCNECVQLGEQLIRNQRHIATTTKPDIAALPRTTPFGRIE